jgi:hypothetical protein
VSTLPSALAELGGAGPRQPRPPSTADAPGIPTYGGTRFWQSIAALWLRRVNTKGRVVAYKNILLSAIAYNFKKLLKQQSMWIPSSPTSVTLANTSFS